MATPPVFSSGAQLTAAQMNKIGLWYIAGATATAGSSYVEILNCFSSDFANYRIVIDGFQASSSASCIFYLGTNATSGKHYGTMFYYQFTGASTGYANANGGNYSFCGLSNSSYPDLGASFDLNNPNTTLAKTFHGTYDGRAYAGWFGGQIYDGATYTGIRFANETGTITAGTFRVYGYRQA